MEFIEVGAAAGINRKTMTYGPAWGDFDGDGDLDIYVGNHEAPPSLYLNQGDGTFTDIFSTSGFDRSARIDRHGAAWGDYDADGRPDLFISIGAERGLGVGKNELYRNLREGALSRGKFKDISAAVGFTDISGRGRDPFWCDIDGDGHLDLYLGNFNTPNRLFRGLGDGKYKEEAEKYNLNAVEQYLVSGADFDRDGDLDIFLGGQKDCLMLNRGKSGFKDITVNSGINNHSWGTRAIAWGDYNNDGYPDLYISRGRAVDAWRKDGNRIEFSAMIPPSDDLDGLDFHLPGKKVSFNLRIDWEPDLQLIFLGRKGSHPAAMPFVIKQESISAIGQPENYQAGKEIGMFIWRDTGTDSWHLRWRGDKITTHDFAGIIESDQPFENVREIDFNYPPRPENILYKNDGKGGFLNVSQEAGIAASGNFRCATWGDYDNDGDLDLYVVNCGDGLHNGPNLLYQNQGDGSFVELAPEAGVTANVDGRGRGAAWGDYNGDGFPDLFLTNGWGAPLFSSGPHLLFKNQGNDNNWLKIKLIGTVSNRLGLGCKVMLKAGDLTQYREQGSGSEMFSQSYQPLHFGLGKNTGADSITVDWPSGKRQVINAVRANQTLEIREK